MKSSWEDVFPEVPESFHESIVHTVNMQISRKTERVIMIKKRLILTVAAILVLGSVTAGAAYLFQWNDKLADRFGVNDTQQDKLAAEGTVADVNQSVTNNGLTVKAVQTLGDKNGLYILLDVKAPEGSALSINNSFEGFKLTIDGTADINYFSGFMDDNADTSGNSANAVNERYYEIWVFNNEQKDLSGSAISISFSNLQVEMGKLDLKTVLQGEWDLSWKLSYSDSTRTFDINKSFDVGGRKVFVKSIELSPLSMSVYVSGEGVTELCDILDVEHCNSLYTPSVLLQDGISFASLGGPGSEGWTDAGKQLYLSRFCFSKVLDVTQVAGVSLTFPTGNASDMITVALQK